MKTPNVIQQLLKLQMTLITIDYDTNQDGHYHTPYTKDNIFTNPAAPLTYLWLNDRQLST
jgi:hypothetical protein